MNIFGVTLDPTTTVFLILALLMALSFEFVNGFHDTANAVATVIYTHSLRPTVAVVWSGLWNLTGVLLSNGAVAFGIVALLPVELVLNVGSGSGFAMVFALLISAIIWNVGTWYLGLPASSSHTLIGAIMGVGLANSLLSPGHVFGEGVNWGKVEDTFAALIISPVIGFVCSALLLLLAKVLIPVKSLYESPEGKQPPPWWIRILLILTCTGVSFGHGSNDGQKGMGLIMLILIGIVPGAFSINPGLSSDEFKKISAYSTSTRDLLQKYVKTPVENSQESKDILSGYLKTDGVFGDKTIGAVQNQNDNLIKQTEGKEKLSDIPNSDRAALRTDIYLIGNALKKASKKIDNPDDSKKMVEISDNYKSVTSFVFEPVKFAIALALGLGTMIGWKRIVVTVGERIGKSHLTYAQGACAELVAASTILMADRYGLPVSTTHVLSSGVAGTMAANRSGLQMATLRNIVLAWVLTLPVCVLLGAGTFAAGLFIVFNLLHIG